MDRDFLAKFGITEFLHENPDGAYPYDLKNYTYETDGKKYVEGEKEDSLYIDKATWSLVMSRDGRKKTLHTEIESKDVLRDILSQYCEYVEDESTDKAKARHDAICSKLNTLRGKRVSSNAELARYVSMYRSFIEGNTGLMIPNGYELENFMEKNCRVYIKEDGDRVDFYLLSDNGEKKLVMEGKI